MLRETKNDRLEIPFPKNKNKTLCIERRQEGNRVQQNENKGYISKVISYVFINSTSYYFLFCQTYN